MRQPFCFMSVSHVECQDKAAFSLFCLTIWSLNNWFSSKAQQLVNTFKSRNQVTNMFLYLGNKRSKWARGQREASKLSCLNPQVRTRTMKIRFLTLLTWCFTCTTTCTEQDASSWFSWKWSSSWLRRGKVVDLETVPVFCCAHLMVWIDVGTLTTSQAVSNSEKHHNTVGPV